MTGHGDRTGNPNTNRSVMALVNFAIPEYLALGKYDVVVYSR
jgi:hypothetical protein